MEENGWKTGGGTQKKAVQHCISVCAFQLTTFFFEEKKNIS